MCVFIQINNMGKIFDMYGEWWENAKQTKVYPPSSLKYKKKKNYAFWDIL